VGHLNMETYVQSLSKFIAFKVGVQISCSICAEVQTEEFIWGGEEEVRRDIS
jgi:hypothetical protein